MLKTFFLMLGFFTFLLNMLLTYYIIINKKGMRTSCIANKEVVSFDLSQHTHKGETAPTTVILETEVLNSVYNEEQVK